MRRLLVRLLINAIALWVTTLVVHGVAIHSYGHGTGPFLLTLLVVAVIFGLVNGIVGGVIRVVAFPLYILTLGIIALFVNALLLLLAAWISGLLHFGLTVSSFGAGFWGALVLAIVAWILGLILRPLAGRRQNT